MPINDEQAEVLEVLSRYGVECIVIGNTAAVIQGAPVITFDTDIVHARDEANVARLVEALESIGAY